MLKTCFTFTLVSVGLLVTNSHAAPVLIGSDTTNGRLVQIDPANAAVTVIGPLGDPIVASLTYDPIHRIVYGSRKRTNCCESNPLLGRRQSLAIWASR